MTSAEREAGPITRWLSGDHQRLEGLLRRATEPRDAIDCEAYADFRRGLLRHIGIEEKILIPAVRRALAGQALAIEARLRLDHGAIAAMLVPTPTPEIVETIRDVLTVHNALEEGPDGLYATCDRLLVEEADSLVARMAAQPEPRVNPHNDAPEVMPALRRALERAGYRSR